MSLPTPIHSLAWFMVWALAFHPVLRWWFERTLDSSDAALGLVSLGILVAVSARERTSHEASPGWIGALVVGVYAVSFMWAPNLVRGLFAAAVLGVMVGRIRGTGALHFGTWGLVAMTLPMLASLRFFLGYPLRWVTTEASALLLRLGGLAVRPDGLALVIGDMEVWVDGPCSGVQMLWVGVFLAAALAFIFRLRNTATVGLFALSLVATVLGNIWRASGVFYMETGLIDAPGFFHDMIGMSAFAIVGIVVVAAGMALRRFDVPVESSKDQSRASKRVLLVAVLLASIVPFATPPSQAGGAEHAFPGWPAQLDGDTLTGRELSERDQPYLAGFPGKVAAFRTTREDVLLRWVTQESRRLHSAADCYRGLGYTVEPMRPLHRGYTSFRVEKEGRRLVVSERISDRSGQHFGEVGEWYWSARLGQTQGPWWSVVRVQSEVE